MSSKVSDTVRESIALSFAHGEANDEIARRTGLRMSRIQSMRRKWARSGEVADSRRGRPVLTKEQELFVLTCMECQPHRFFREMCSAVKTHYGKVVTQSLIHGILKRNGWNRAEVIE